MIKAYTNVQTISFFYPDQQVCNSDNHANYENRIFPLMFTGMK